MWDEMSFARDYFSKTSVPSYSSPFQNNTQPKFFSSSKQKPKLRPTKYFKDKYNKVKANLALLSSSALASKSLMVKNKGLVVEAYELDEEYVSSDDNEMIEVKVLMALVDDENVDVGKENAKIGPKVVFRDDATCTTKGYGSIKCKGKVFTQIAPVNGLKYNLISKSQLCNAKYIVQFDENKGIIFNSNKEVVVIALRIKQSEKDILINQEKYVKDLQKKYDINGSLVKTLMVPPNNLGPDLHGKDVNETHYRGLIGSLMYLKGTLSLGLCYPKCLGFDLKGYSKSNYVGCNMDMKSILAKAEYVAVVRCCANILWMKSQLTDYDIIYEKISLYQKSYSKGDIELHFITTQYQLIDIFTKPLDDPTFKRLIVELGTKPHVLIDKTKSTSEGLETIITESEAIKGCNSDDAKKKIKLEDLSKLILNVKVDFIDMDSAKDDEPIIIQDKDEEELTELLVKSLTPELSKVLSSLDFSNSLPTELKDLPSKFKDLSGEIKELNKFAQAIDAASHKAGDQSIPSTCQAITYPVEGDKNTKQATTTQLFKQRIKKDDGKENLRTQPIQTTSPITTTVTSPIIPTTIQLQSSFLSGPQSEGEPIKNKGKEAMTHKESEEEKFETESKTKVRLTEDQIKEHKRIKESVKVIAKREEEVGKEKLVDLLGIDVVKSMYKAKIKDDGTEEVIYNLRASDLHLRE
uniref:Retrovirus-related Pol polyprotein from transposon TNT 1-94 n=1 Tax=Tanacetum cinerariifolium TaxID=118510 RepID=A0A699H2K4_TANCI|nr:retrovirus-related Pol polyprotein from transposon TNT 1-94 [Tanacetum cinerariifolium]